MAWKRPQNGSQLLAEELTIGLSLRDVAVSRRRRALRAHVGFTVQGIQVFEEGGSQTRPKLS